MKNLIIDNWQQHGDYMLYANLVDEVGEWIMLQTQGSKIIATGKEKSIQKFGELLTAKDIDFEFTNAV